MSCLTCNQEKDACSACGRAAEVDDAGSAGAAEAQFISTELQLTTMERATQETVFHHNKAGLATRFRSRGPSSQDLQVDEVEAGELTPDAFWDRYVSRNQPVVICNAVVRDQGWPNSDHFTVPTLKSLIGQTEVDLRCRPIQGRVFGDVSRFAAGSVRPYDYERVTLAAFFESLEQDEPPYYAARLELQVNCENQSKHRRVFKKAMQFNRIAEDLLQRV